MNTATPGKSPVEEKPAATVITESKANSNFKPRILKANSVFLDESLRSQIISKKKMDIKQRKSLDIEKLDGKIMPTVKITEKPIFSKETISMSKEEYASDDSCDLFDPSQVFICMHRCQYWDSKDNIRKGKIFLTNSELFFKVSRMPFVKFRLNLKDVTDVSKLRSFRYTNESVLLVETKSGKEFAFLKFKVPKNRVRNQILQILDKYKKMPNSVSNLFNKNLEAGSGGENSNSLKHENNNVITQPGKIQVIKPHRISSDYNKETAEKQQSDSFEIQEKEKKLNVASLNNNKRQSRYKLGSSEKNGNNKKETGNSRNSTNNFKGVQSDEKTEFTASSSEMNIHGVTVVKKETSKAVMVSEREYMALRKNNQNILTLLFFLLVTFSLITINNFIKTNLIEFQVNSLL